MEDEDMKLLKSSLEAARNNITLHAVNPKVT